MEYVKIVLQLIAGLGILNVWLLRRDKATPYRGKEAKSMKEEFQAYGLPDWAVPVVGVLKCLCAIGLLVGIFVPQLVLPSAIGLGVLMLGAFAMHMKVNDPIGKAVPAITLLLVCVLILVL